VLGIEGICCAVPDVRMMEAVTILKQLDRHPEQA
jgi:hypothetical protein